MNFIEIANASTATQEPSALGFLLPIFILVLMYFILIRPRKILYKLTWYHINPGIFF